MIAADTSRTRAYLAALERHDLLPSFVLLLIDVSTQAEMPGQLDRSAFHSEQKENSSDQAIWSEAGFDPSTPLVPWMERLGVRFEISGSREINDNSVIDLLERSEPSVFIYSGYGGGLLREDVLSCGKRFLHVHGGYLPNYKGSTTNYYSLLAEDAIGASAIFLTQEIDCGPVLTRRRFPPPLDRANIDHVYDSAARAKVLVETLEKYNSQGDWSFEFPDNSGGETYYIIHPVLKHLAIMAGDED